MLSETLGTVLPASINDGAAWAAFDHVQKLPWTIRFASDVPLTLDVDHDLDFQLCLDGAGAFDFQKQARAHVAMRVLEIAASIDEGRLRGLGHSIDGVRSCAVKREKALHGIRDAIVVRIRSELTQLFFVRADVWAERLRTLILTLPPEQRAQVARYCGLDQEVTSKEIRAGLNYVFRTIEPEILRDKDRLFLVGHERKLREAKGARNDINPKARARNLVVRAAEARLASGAPGDLSSTLASLEADLRKRVTTEGCWGLIDTVIHRDRERESLDLPLTLSPEIWDMIRQQQRRISLQEG